MSDKIREIELVAEVERLKQDIKIITDCNNEDYEYLKQEYETKVAKLKNKIEIYELAEKAYIENGNRLEQENEQLREALKKCSPFWIDDDDECLFCNSRYGHRENCEYIRLTGGSE